MIENDKFIHHPRDCQVFVNPTNVRSRQRWPLRPIQQKSKQIHKKICKSIQFVLQKNNISVI
jgi:hypothetical protein